MTGHGAPTLRLHLVDHDGWDPGLDPVATALRDAAAREADAVLEAAGAEAAAVLSSASREADDLLDRARRDGAAAAREAGQARLAEARRRGRDTVLEAQDAGYRALRAGVLSELRDRLDTPGGRRLRSYLLDLVTSKGYGPAVERFGPDGGWTAEARSASTTVALGLEALVDQAMSSLAGEVAGLWR